MQRTEVESATPPYQGRVMFLYYQLATLTSVAPVRFLYDMTTVHITSIESYNASCRWC